MKIAIIGTGYVGLVSGACFAELGAEVTCIDTDRAKIERLRQGEIPIYEPNLDTMVVRNYKAGRLNFITDVAQCMADVEIVFCAVGTPQQQDGRANMSYVREVARTIGEKMDKYVLFVTKSTVPVGTSKMVREIIQAELDRREIAIEFDVASNPEFLKEGDAIYDFMKPDRIVVGIDSQRAQELMTRLYKPMLLNNFRVIFMDIASAEMTKYAANAMLATRISFMNDIANLCELVGADVNMVRHGMGTDNRIGSKFLFAGCGYGGSCFPKDIRALVNIGRENNYRMQLLEAVDDINDRQKEVLFNKFSAHFGGKIAGKRVALWGLAFKPNTDDIREAPSLVLIEKLLAAGCSVVGYDPVAMDECRKVVGERIIYARDMYDAANKADAIFHVTEWKEFRMPNWDVIRKSMNYPLLIDGRNIYTPSELEGITYLRIG